MTKFNRREETKREELLRRLTDYIEFATARKVFSDVGFYEDLYEYIQGTVENDTISSPVSWIPTSWIDEAYCGTAEDMVEFIENELLTDYGKEMLAKHREELEKD